MAKDRNGPWRYTKEEIRDEPQYEDDDSVHPNQQPPTNGKYRMRDWKRLGTAIVLFVIFLVFILITISKSPNLSPIVLLLGTTVFLLWMIAHSLGMVFDFNNKQLRYPSFIIRRRVPLFEIRDANAQVVYRTLMSSAANALNKGAHHRPNRQYAVNISGEFGTRNSVRV